MAKNDNLHKAKDAKNDEFYTRIDDVAEELRHYKKHFAGKVYQGVMGVPITFLDKYNSKQFEIVGCADANIIPPNWKGMSKKFVNQYYEQGNTGSYKEGNRLACYISTTGKAVVPYKRILIRQHI